MKKLTDEEKRVLREIGYYFLEGSLKIQEYDEALNSTYKLLHTLNITGIETVGDDHYLITLCRPGLFIGSRGNTINSICEKLKIKIDIEENRICDLVFPPDLNGYSYEED